MKWVMLTRTDNTRTWFNFEKFEMFFEAVDDDGAECTALVTIIGEEEFCEIHVKEKPEEIWNLLEKKFGK
jgi:hypothetical protein